VNWKTLLIGKWSWKRPLYSLAGIYFLLSMFGCFMADQIIFQPPGTPYPEDRRGFSMVGSEEMRTAVFHLPAKPGRPTLLWSHGNAQNLKSLKPMLESFHLRGFGVLSYDYPGYGESSGSPSEEGCYQAISLSYQHLTENLGVAPDKVVLVGQSVGSGPTTWLAAREKHAAVVLISPFLSAFRSVTRIPLFPGDRFPNDKHLRNVKTPLLVIHGEDDKVIPFSNGRTLFDKSPSKQKTFLPVQGAGHNDLFLSGRFDLGELILAMLDQQAEN
jgi:pimeloyl-ACP methyl ester carboxylesterase